MKRSTPISTRPDTLLPYTTLFRSIEHQSMNLVACLGINQRAYRNLLVEPVTHLQGCHPFGQPCAKRLADRRVDVETIGRRTGLTHVAHLGRSEEHTSELQSLMRISYAVFCLKKKHNINTS